MTQELQGPFTKPPTVFRWLWLASLVGFFTFVFFLALGAAEADLKPVQTSHVVPKVQNGATTLAPDPCGLRDVECPQESATASVASQEKPQRVIRATVYTYQAVPEQTDETPCVGAMPGVDFCNPPFPIVANNCLPLGTKVEMYANTYTVADRMASHHGCNVFDILTTGENFKLIADVYVP